MKTLKQITVSAPGKLLLLGDHAVVYGHPCLVTAVDYRVFVEVSLSEKDEFIFPEGNGNSFVYTALDLFRNKFKFKQFVRTKTWAGHKESYGLGSSSAVTVAFVKALSELFSTPLSKKELFDLCYEVVLQVQGVGSGFDIAAAIWGGTLYFMTGGKQIEPVDIDSLPLVVAYSGAKGNTADLVKKVGRLREERPLEINTIFLLIASLVEEGKRLLEEKKYRALGEVLDKNHALLQRLNVSTPKLDELVQAARKSGAFGAKLSGAGGGDCIIVITPEEKREEVEQVLKKAGGTILTVKTNEEGVRIENDTNN